MCRTVVAVPAAFIRFDVSLGRLGEGDGTHRLRFLCLPLDRALVDRVNVVGELLTAACALSRAADSVIVRSDRRRVEGSGISHLCHRRDRAARHRRKMHVRR